MAATNRPLEQKLQVTSDDIQRAALTMRMNAMREGIKARPPDGYVLWQDAVLYPYCRNRATDL